MAEESKDLVKVDPSAPPKVIEPELATENPERVVVVAKNPEELNQSQARLVEWAQKKIKKEKTDLKELKENLELSIQRKWRSSHLQRLVSEKKKLVEFYEKVGAALKEGYYIIPDLPLDVFAIRTTRKGVRQNLARQTGFHPTVREQESNLPPLGEGRYESPQALTAENERTLPAEPGKMERVQYSRYAVDWGEIDFPFLTTAKPEVLKATTAAMDKLIFDEMGVAPSRNNAGRDPMVVGKIFRRHGYITREVCFLVAWFLDTDDI